MKLLHLYYFELCLLYIDNNKFNRINRENTSIVNPIENKTKNSPKLFSGSGDVNTEYNKMTIKNSGNTTDNFRYFFII